MITAFGSRITTCSAQLKAGLMYGLLLFLSPVFRERAYFRYLDMQFAFVLLRVL